MLKNVVLPAPFGPIRLTMERSGMSKSTALTATRPPKTLVIPRASRMLADVLVLLSHGPFPQRVTDVAAFAAAQLFGALAVGDYALGPQEHHEDKEEAEQEELYFGMSAWLRAGSQWRCQSREPTRLSAAAGRS